MKILSSKLLEAMIDDFIKNNTEPSGKTFMMLAKEYLKLYSYAEAIAICVRKKKHPAQLQNVVNKLEQEMP